MGAYTPTWPARSARHAARASGRLRKSRRPEEERGLGFASFTRMPTSPRRAEQPLEAWLAGRLAADLLRRHVGRATLETCHPTWGGVMVKNEESECERELQPW